MSVHRGHRDRMRRRFLDSGLVGLNGFSDHEVLEMLLYYAIPQGDVNPLAHNLLERFGSLSAVFSAPVELLTQVKGIGERTAVLLRLVPLAAQRSRLSDMEGDVILDGSDKVGEYLLELLSQERNEAAYELCMDSKGKLLHCHRLGEGGPSVVNLDIRKVVENALISSASSVILAHNHPSGLALPSREDYQATDQAHKALAAIGVRLEDHIIIADGDYISFAQSGYLHR